MVSIATAVGVLALLAAPAGGDGGAPAAAAAAPAPPPLPGVACRSDSGAVSSSEPWFFFGQSWSNTCECTEFPPQKPGDQCNWWTQPCGYCCRTCNVTNPSAFQCKSFDNVMMLPQLVDAKFGDNAEHNVQCILHGVSYSGACDFGDKSVQQLGCTKLPKGKCTVRLYDADLYIATNTSDFVKLLPEDAICGDPTVRKQPNQDPASFSGLWWDAGVAEYARQSALFFPALQKAFAEGGDGGATLDGIYQDQEEDPTRQSMLKAVPLAEFMPSAKLNDTLKLHCLRARYTAIQRDGRFPAVLALLRERGFDASKATEEWLADAMVPFATNMSKFKASADLEGKLMAVWDSVHLERMSLSWKAALSDVARKSFPAVRHTNAGRYVWDPKYCPVDGNGNRPCRAVRERLRFCPPF
jgi:hypothetical protein